ncbi:MAG: ribosome maturation factor RimM [Peptococcaceae bacterium]|nr:ribosome maturation factor RimM [Peptococcaceae bacterium]
METVLIGRVTRAQGVHGELRVTPFTYDPKRYEELREVILQADAQTRRRFAVHQAKVQADAVYLALEGIHDRNLAETFRGWEVRIDRKDVRPLAEGWYYFELEGLRVYDREDDLGVLKQVVATGANDVYVVEGPRGQVCVPALKSVVQEVDLAQGVMRVMLPPGMLEDDEKS